MKLRTASDVDRFRMALVPVDEAFFASETRWGVGRLERLVSAPTLAAYRRGWDAYRVALDEGDADAVEAIAPKMIAALAFMDQEVIQAGHLPIAPETWEAPMSDGTVLVVCRTNAEACAVIRATNGKAHTAIPGGAARVQTNGTVLVGETKLPPDLTVTIRDQHAGRDLHVISLAEVVRLVEKHGSVVSSKWEGTPAHTGRQMHEMAAHDLVRQGSPVVNSLALDF